MPTQTQIFSDNFQRADNPVLGPNYAVQIPGFGITGNLALSESAGQNLTYWGLPRLNVNCYAIATVGSSPGATGSAGVALTDGANNWYAVTCPAVGGTGVIQRYAAGVETDEATFTSPALAVGDVIELDYHVGQVSALYNGKKMAAFQDKNALSVYYAGLWCINTGGTFMAYSNFVGGSMDPYPLLGYADHHPHHQFSFQH